MKSIHNEIITLILLFTKYRLTCSIGRYVFNGMCTMIYG